MKKISEYLFLWAVGGCMYYGFEMVFRGFSHWTMFVLGGICFVFFAVQGKMLHWQDPLWMQIGRCMVFVTSSFLGRSAFPLSLFFPALPPRGSS